MKSSGKWVVVGLIGLAVCAALGAVLFQYQATRRTLEMWGPDVVELIAKGTQVEALFLEPPPDAGDGAPAGTLAGDVLWIDGRPLRIAKRVDLSGAAGLTHLRTALLADASYQWDETPPAATWEVALSFGDAAHKKTIAFALVDRCMWDLDSPEPVVLSAKIAGGMATFLADYKNAPQ